MTRTDLLLLLLLLLPCTCARAQMLTDDFEDGDLLNPEWFGDTADFVVTDGRLRLMADGAGESTLNLRLPTNGGVVGEFSLEFLVDMDFSPSTSNFCSISLVQEALVGTNRGNRLNMKFGGVSGATDTWEGVFTVFDDIAGGSFSGDEGALGMDPAIVRFRIEFDTLNGYRFLADYTGGRDFQLQGQIASSIWFDVDLLQLNCFYTSSRSDRFSFDDLNVSSRYLPDDRAPSVRESRVDDAATITLVYDEPVRDEFALLPENYTLSLAENSVVSVATDQQFYVLTLANPLPVREDFTITITQAVDRAGNVRRDEMLTLRYDPEEAPSTENVVINEFMADPTPVVGLPEQEYIELYNPTAATVNLTGMAVASGGNPVVAPENTRLYPGAYLILTRPELADEFRTQGISVALMNLPTLSNAADRITLLFDGDTLSDVRYTDDWYNDPDRNDGGHSIEYIGQGADAGCSGSWRASMARSGGTPGAENSVTGMSADQTPPALESFSVSPNEISLRFTEPIDADVVADLISIEPTLDFTYTAFGDDGIRLSTRLAEGTIYTLALQPDFSDCTGNFPAEAITTRFALPGDPVAGDVVINEILFNPATGGSDFVELYNCSDKVFQVNGWTLRNNQSTSTAASQTISADRLFLPGDHLTFTADREDVLRDFPNALPELLVEQRLPTLPDDAGNLTVIANGILLDAFDYSEDFHSALLSPNDGVSLERLRQKATTQDPANWFSAASAVGFGTPTRPNSQARETPLPEVESTFSLVSETFSPDGDGFEDQLELRYQTEAPGFLARVTIFDAQGRQVRALNRIELLGTEGILNWDGENDEGRKAKAGLYVLYVELFNPNGETRQEKLAAVLAGRR